MPISMLVWVHSFIELANSQNICDNLKTYLKTTSYDHFLDVLRQLVWAQFGFTDRPIVLRSILRYVHLTTS